MRSLAVAITFLTRVPLPITVHDAREVDASVPWFGVVGLLVGMVVGGTTAGAARVLDPTLAATLGVAAGMVMTGAFHEDGLADTFDGLPGGHEASRRLEIMRDSRLGTFGAAALVMALLLQVRAGALLATRALPWFVVGHGISRVVATGVMAASRPARGDGLGAQYLSGGRRPAIAVGAAIVASVGLVVLGDVPAWVHLATWGVAGLVAVGVRAWAYRAVDGVTGDVLGAIQVISLVAVLLVGTVVSA